MHYIRQVLTTTEHEPPDEHAVSEIDIPIVSPIYPLLKSDKSAAFPMLEPKTLLWKIEELICTGDLHTV